MEKAKIKAKSKNGITKVKAMFKHPMISEDIAKRRGVKPNYITNIIVKHNGYTVFDGSVGMMLSISPYVKFAFVGGDKGDELELTAIDNSGVVEISKGIIK